MPARGRTRGSILVAAALAACGGGGGEATSASVAPEALFAPDAGQLPLPNDLWFAGSADGTLTPPTSADPIQAALDAQLDGLDGWSTVAPIRFPFSEAIDPTTVTLGSSVRLFQVTLVAAAAFVGGPVDVVVRELDAAEVAATVGDAGQSIVLTPLAPLAPQSAYTAVVTREVRGTSGIPVAPAGPFAEALLGPALAPSDAQFELQQRLQAEAQALAPFGIDADQIASTTTFSTQSIDSVQQALVAIAKGEEAEFVAQLQLDAPFLDFSAPLAEAAPAATVGVEGVVDLPLPDGIPIWLSRFHRGWLEVPYYLDAPAERASVNGDTSILTSRFRTRFQFGPDDDARHTTRFNPLPAVRSVQRIPMLITEPLTAPKPATGWPVLVFQHGITGDRANLQALSITLGAARIAAVAIDLPLHGITNDEDPLFAGFDSGADGVRERHFGLDALTVADDGEQQLGEDGQPDPSGAHFIQFESLVTTRDHVKQAVADLLQLLSVLEQVDLDGDGLGDFDTSQVYFVGHSLGAVVGAEFLPFAEGLTSATLGMPGCGLAGLLANSPAFRERIEAGVTELGILPGTPAYTTFLDRAQAASDSADPINHAAALVADGLALHLIEVVGETDPITGEVISPPDDTIPPNIEGFPLSGTDPLIEALQLPTVTQTTVDPSGVRAAVRFVRGDHLSLLIPTDFNDIDLSAAWQEMQGQAIDFAFNAGQILTITSESLVTGE